MKPNPLVIDLSHHNQTPDFKKLKAAGIVGVIAKATQGTTFVDLKFLKYQAAVLAAGLPFAAYHFLDGSDYKEQIRHFVGTTPGVKLRFLDYESHEENTCSQGNAEAAWRFLAGKQGRAPGTYGSNLLVAALVDRECPFHCGPLWIARYSNKRPQGTWDLWQYTDQGKINGAPSLVDLSTYRTGSSKDCAEWLQGWVT